MEILEFFPKEGEVQRNYCDKCKGNLDLQFTNFHETVSGVEISISDLPVLYCSKCDKFYMPDDSKFTVIYIHEQAIKKSTNRVTVQRKKPNQKFNYGLVSFIYDSDDYKYIPGLKRPGNDGFLTPVFFNQEVLLKYDASPTYRLTFASATYGNICRGNDFSIPFGINKNGKIIMWLGDISELPEKEQHYLCSENIDSDHSIGSEFYDGQIECIFTDLSKEDELYKSRSLFLETCYQKFGIKIASLDKEVLELSLSFNAPIIDTNKEYKHIADTLNKIYLESFDKEAMAKIIEKFDGNPEKLGSIKRLEMLLELSTKNNAIKSLINPFYVLYDLRVACLHLHPEKNSKEILSSIKERLDLKEEAGLLEIYDALIIRLKESFDLFTELLSTIKNT